MKKNVLVFWINYSFSLLENGIEKTQQHKQYVSDFKNTFCISKNVFIVLFYYFTVW